MQTLKGIPASPGIAIGPVYQLVQHDLEVKRHQVEDPQAEIDRLERALKEAKAQIDELQEKAEQEATTEEAAIFEAHAMFLEDPAIVDTAHQLIQDEKVNAEAALLEAIEKMAQQLEAMQDDYFSARAADVRDVGNRVARILLGVEETDLSSLQKPSIILARDLTPSDTVRLDKNLVLGFCTAEGGPTSHTAILAKALCLPAVVGASSAVLTAESGKTMIIDGSTGEVFVEPDEEQLRTSDQARRVYEQQAQADLLEATDPAKTTDGHLIEVVANVGNPEDTLLALERGAEGIGLLRTEFLYLERSSSPNEAEQLAAYNAILDTMEDRPVVVRTLDVGGDKELPYLDLGEETNPFLGWRAIRMCLDQPDFFKIQLRALLRASPEHDLRIMFPMIATLDEVRRSKALLEQARAELVKDGHEVSDKIQIGIMVEIPAVAVLADLFAREVDFFSIGTNDLTQYTMAAERTNERVAHLGDAAHPAVLRQIQGVIEAAHAEGIWVGLCGELAGDEDAIPVLLGLGLDEFSMSPISIPHAKQIIRSWSVADAQKLVDPVLALDSAAAVREYVRCEQKKRQIN
ncbi:MAG: phosphoenolpyruvate--protein phosphotransferase [Anaerolineales bacterium]|jgi:phosphotransferase system enzyme I (PtsI)